MSGKNGCVLLILPSLPSHATRKELKKFVYQGMAEAGYRGFARSLAVSHCSILRLTDPATGNSESHGLVQIRPLKAAYEAIDAFKNKQFLGSKIEVRRYRQRSDDGYLGMLPPGSKERRRTRLSLDLVES